MTDKLKWWGYLHTNGQIQVKRYLSPMDLEEADESPFVNGRTDVFEAASREEAIENIKKELGLVEQK